MSLEDIKHRIQKEQADITDAEAAKKAAEKERSQLEDEIKKQISGAVNSAIYGQDASIELLTNELKTTNSNYKELQREVSKLNHILSDTKHLKEIYDTREKQLDKEAQGKAAARQEAMMQLDAEYDTKVREHRARMNELEKQNREEEEKLRQKKRNLYWKRKGITIGIIICFLVALIGGAALGIYLITNGIIKVDIPKSTIFGW